MLLGFIATLYLAVQVTAPPTDHCATLAKTINYANAKACLESFPFNQQQFTQIVDNVLKMLEMHAFIDITNNSPDPVFQPSYNFKGAVQALKTRRFQNDKEAMEALSAAHVKMNDAHCVFTPSCYRAISYTQAFFPIAIPDPTGKVRIFVGGLPQGSDAKDKKHIGREILSIHGKPAFEVLWFYTQNRVGYYKDASARFNEALARMVWDDKAGWSLNGGAWAVRDQLPNSRSVKFTFAAANGMPEETVEHEWSVVIPTNFKTAQQYWTQNCLPVAPKTTTRNKKASGTPTYLKKTPPDDDHVDMQHRKKTKTFKEFLLAANKANLPKALLKSDGLGFFQHPKNPKIGILKITTFEPTCSFSTWRRSLAGIVSKFKALRMTKLIVDLTGNGGGYIKLSWDAIGLLVPKKGGPNYPGVSRRFKRDFRLSPLARAMVEKSIQLDADVWMHPELSGVPNTNRVFKGKELITPRQRPRASPNEPPYAQLHMDVPEDPKGNPLASLSFGLAPQDIVVLSSGDCGSACAMFFLRLREIDGVRGAALGALPNRPRQVSGFPITQVTDMASLMSDLKTLKLETNPLAPKPFPVAVDYMFPVRQAYSNRKGMEDRIEEYLFTGADVLIDVDRTLALRPDMVWVRLASLLGWNPGVRVKKTAVYATSTSRPYPATPGDNQATKPSELRVYRPPAGQEIERAPLGTVLIPGQGSDRN